MYIIYPIGPQSIKYRSADCSGFQDDVFKTIQEHFQLLPEPLITRQLIQVFTKISGELNNLAKTHLIYSVLQEKL